MFAHSTETVPARGPASASALCCAIVRRMPAHVTSFARRLNAIAFIPVLTNLAANTYSPETREQQQSVTRVICKPLVQSRF